MTTLEGWQLQAEEIAILTLCRTPSFALDYTGMANGRSPLNQHSKVH